mmetsp:Transcript_110128/g.350911  ORF Transcript_110128/g.350911 Transcript_110128/m.350911 type:complete len:256 (-) Transcript_110128:297-1064(-)
MQVACSPSSVLLRPRAAACSAARAPLALRPRSPPAAACSLSEAGPPAAMEAPAACLARLRPPPLPVRRMLPPTPGPPRRARGGTPAHSRGPVLVTKRKTQLLRTRGRRRRLPRSWPSAASSVRAAPRGRPKPTARPLRRRPKRQCRQQSKESLFRSRPSTPRPSSPTRTPSPGWAATRRLGRRRKRLAVRLGDCSLLLRQMQDLPRQRRRRLPKAGPSPRRRQRRLRRARSRSRPEKISGRCRLRRSTENGIRTR